MTGVVVTSGGRKLWNFSFTLYTPSPITDIKSAPPNARISMESWCVWEVQADWWLFTETRKSRKLKWSRAIHSTPLNPSFYFCSMEMSFFNLFCPSGCQNNKTEKKKKTLYVKFIGTSGKCVMKWHSLIVTWYLMTSAGSTSLHFPFGRELCHLYI